MAEPSLSVDEYLNRSIDASHVLGRLVRHPEPEHGAVHTPREIAQQPHLWRYAAALMTRHADDLRAFLARAGAYEERGPAFLLTGAGTSHYIGQSVADLLRRHFQAPVLSVPTTRITACPDAYLIDGRRYVMLHAARSGNSPESRAVLDLALQRYAETARHVVITCNADGELAEMARADPDRVYLITLPESSNDKGLAMTSSFSTIVTCMQVLCHLDDTTAFQGLVARIARAGEYLVEHYADTLYECANPKLTRAFFLGNADLLGAAMESALKIQELTAGEVMAAGEDTLAFRHGPISAVNAHSLVCFFLSADAYTRRYEADVLQQYQEAFGQLGAQTIVVSAQQPELELADSTRSITYEPGASEAVPPYYQVNLAALVGQLLGLFAAYRRGQNVDNPSEKRVLYSRTVKGVRLYDIAGDGAHTS